jgi:hypothetical protein
MQAQHKTELMLTWPEAMQRLNDQKPSAMILAKP